MLSENTEQISEVNTEIPIFLAIMNETGQSLFSQAFSEEWTFDDQLFAGLLNAFKKFSEEIFSGTFDRAKFGEYFLVLKISPPLLICYVFKRSIAAAQKKIGQLATRLQNNQKIWPTVLEAIKKSECFRKMTNPFSKIISELFE